MFSHHDRGNPDANGIRKTRGLAVRNTYPDLFTTTINDWLASYGDLGRFVAGGIEPPHQKLAFELPDDHAGRERAAFHCL